MKSGFHKFVSQNQKLHINTNEMWLASLNVVQMFSSCLSGRFLGRISCEVTHYKSKSDYVRLLGLASETSESFECVLRRWTLLD